MGAGEGKRLTMGDWGVLLAAVVIAVAVGFLPSTVSQSFREMFRDYGSIDELPWLTRAVLSRWYAVVGTAPMSAALIGALIVWGRPRARRAILVSAVALGLVSVGVYLYGVYSPIFALAEAMGP